MVRFFEGRGASEQSVSRLTGILAASLPAAQFLTSFFWGRFSDTVGRKPVMLVGNVSGALSMFALGWSPVYAAALTCRFIGGLFNGTSVCVLHLSRLSRSGCFLSLYLYTPISPCTDFAVPGAESSRQ